MGGAWFQDVFGDPDAVTEEHLLARATEAVQCHLGVTTAPSWSWVALHRVWQACVCVHVFACVHGHVCFGCARMCSRVCLQARVCDTCK